MPTELSDYQSLCQTLKYLQVDVLSGRKLQDIMSDMRKGKGDWDPEGWGKIGGQKSLARDSAFRLVYGILMDEFNTSERVMAYNVTSFTVSHPGMFKCRTRAMVRRAFEQKFPVSDKQRKGLDMWSIEDPSLESVEDDCTTEAYSPYYDSDNYAYYYDSDD